MIYCDQTVHIQNSNRRSDFFRPFIFYPCVAFAVAQSSCEAYRAFCLGTHQITDCQFRKIGVQPQL